MNIMDTSATDGEANNSSKFIYITEEEHRSEWSYDATKELLKIYDEKSDMLETGIITTQKRLWELTSKALAKKGFYYTGPQCENKWKALKRAYRTKLERVQKFGTYKRACPFENEISEILSKRPNESIIRSYAFKINAMKRDEDLFNKVNLNEPPGFTKEENIFEQEDDDIKNIALDELPSESVNYNQPTYTVIQQEPDMNQSLLVNELAGFKKIFTIHSRMNTKVLKQTSRVHNRILDRLDRVVVRRTKSLEIEEKRVKQQDEIIKQMKIQNELLQKLIDKFA